MISTAQDFIEAFEAGQFTPQHRDAFNRKIAARYEGVRDYIVAHYRMNQRSDSEYWRDNAANQALSGELKSMMTAWFTHRDIAAANAELYPVQAYASMSWHCLLAGYGTFPQTSKMQDLPPELTGADLGKIRGFIASCSDNYPAFPGS